jgi:hypothetical protein
MPGVLAIFVLGIANFAMHKAVLESGHPLVGRMPWFVHMLGGRAEAGLFVVVAENTRQQFVTRDIYRHARQHSQLLPRQSR